MDLFSNNNVNTNVALSNNDTAKIFIFPPRRVYDKGLFPLTYNFDMTFIDTVVEGITEGGHKNIVSNGSLVGINAIAPSAKPILTKSSIYSMYYSFMLIVDGEKNINQHSLPNSGISFQVPKNYRIVYLGFFEDEPVNPLTLNQIEPTFNHNCLMRINRKTIYKKIQQQTMFDNNRPMVVSDQLITCHDGNDDITKYQLNPENVEYSDENLASISHHGSINAEKEISSESTWQSPKVHLSNFIQSMSDAYQIMVGEQGGGFDYIEDAYGAAVIDSFKHNDNSRDIANVHNVGFKTDVPLYLGQVFQTVDPDIIVIKTTPSDQLSVIGSNEVSPETVFGSLIESTVSGYLLKWGIASVSLSYDSYSNDVQLYSIESIDVCQQDMLEPKFNHFWGELRRGILDFLKTSCGDFSLNLFSHISANNIINLVFYDFRTFGAEDYMVNFNPLGGSGANSQIGTGNEVLNNITNVATVLNHATQSLGLH